MDPRDHVHPHTPGPLGSAAITRRSVLRAGGLGLGALAVNGVPIFNALNNRGDGALLAGELDQWGGHAGRADDYRYNVAPLHPQDAVGPTSPIAWALDGYPIYGSLEPDGSAMRTLDDLNGHDDGAGGCHYQGTRTYPYINGGLRRAAITSFSSPRTGARMLGYTIGGRAAQIEYTPGIGTTKFVFTDPTGAVRTETYTRPG